MPDGEHQFVNIALAGVRSPRVSSRQDEVSEQWGEEVISRLPATRYIYSSPIYIVRLNSSRSRVFCNDMSVYKSSHYQPLQLHLSKRVPTHQRRHLPPPSLLAQVYNVLFNMLSWLNNSVR